MKKNQTEKRNIGCFSWLVRLKRSVNERWARERNTFIKKFYKDNGNSLAAYELLNETGTPDLLISKVPVCSKASQTHQEQITEPVTRGFNETKNVASQTEPNHPVVAEHDNEEAVAIPTDSESVPVISQAHEYNENNVRVDVIAPVMSGFTNSPLTANDPNLHSAVIVCRLAFRLNEHNSLFGDVSVMLTQDTNGAPIEYDASASLD